MSSLVTPCVSDDETNDFGFEKMPRWSASVNSDDDDLTPWAVASNGTDQTLSTPRRVDIDAQLLKMQQRLVLLDKRAMPVVWYFVLFTCFMVLGAVVTHFVMLAHTNEVVCGHMDALAHLAEGHLPLWAKLKPGVDVPVQSITYDTQSSSSEISWLTEEQKITWVPTVGAIEFSIPIQGGISKIISKVMKENEQTIETLRLSKRALRRWAGVDKEEKEEEEEEEEEEEDGVPRSFFQDETGQVSKDNDNFEPVMRFI